MLESNFLATFIVNGVDLKFGSMFQPAQVYLYLNTGIIPPSPSYWC